MAIRILGQGRHINGSMRYNNNEVWHNGNDGAGSGLDADKWDNNEFADFLNQAVRTTDEPTFQQLTLGYPADSDYEAVRGDKTITISTPDGSPLFVNGGHEVSKKMINALAFILQIAQADLLPGANCNGANINNGAGAILGDVDVSIDLPQRIDTEADFKAKSLHAGSENTSVRHPGTVVNGYGTNSAQPTETAMCSGNYNLKNNYDHLSNTTEFHQSSAYDVVVDDFWEITPIFDNNAEYCPAIGVSFDYDVNFSHLIQASVKVALTVKTGTDIYEQASLFFDCMARLNDSTGLWAFQSKLVNSFTSNYLSNTLATSVFRNANLVHSIISGRHVFSLYIQDVVDTALDWFGVYNTSQFAGFKVISSWKFDINLLQSFVAGEIVTKKK